MQEQPRCETYAATSLLAGSACMIEPPDGIVATTAPAEPPPLTRALVERGRDRFQRVCASCHGVAADGDSYVSRVMMLRHPPSLVDAAAASLTDDRIVFTIGHGYGVMPSYAFLPLSDRYAVLHYVRALQRREVAVDELPAKLQQEVARWLR
jgi:mono/diheme cytochrome c family protein